MFLRLKEMSEEEFNIIHESVLKLLNQTGFLFENAEALKLFKKAGMKVDNNGRVFFKPDFIESMISKIPKNGFKMYGRDGTRKIHLSADRIAFRPSIGHPFVLDYDTGQRRNAVLEDAKRAACVVDALEGYDLVNSIVNPADAPGGFGNLQLFVNSFSNSLKPVDITVKSAAEVIGIVKLAEAVRGGKDALKERPLMYIDIAVISPLKCPEEEVDAFIECAKRGIPVEVLSAPALGLTGPITFSGSTVLSLAEMIAMLCLVYLIEPGLGMVLASRVTPSNMRTGIINFGAPEMAISSVLIAECCSRYNLPSNLYGFGSSAKKPGGQAEMEKMLSGVLMSLNKPSIITGGGTLDNGLNHSLEQLVIDDQAISFIKRVRQQVSINEETIGLEAIKRSMNSSGSMLLDKHTLKYLRGEGLMIDCSMDQWINSFEQWQKEGSPALYDLAHKKVEGILSSHKVEPVDKTMKNKINSILEEMKKYFN